MCHLLVWTIVVLWVSPVHTYVYILFRKKDAYVGTYTWYTRETICQ